MRRRTGIGAAAIVAATMLVTGCSSAGGDEVDRQEAEKVAEEARGYMDDLAAMLGAEPDVRQDTLSDCVPGQDDSGLTLFYNVQVATKPGAPERLGTDVRQAWESRGWKAEMKKPTDLRLTKGPFAMGAALSSDGTRAVINGSGGCVQ